MSSEETIDLRIQDVVYRGRGLARLDGMVYFVDGVLPDELVRVKIRSRKKSWVDAELIDVLENSSSRVPPACEFADKCEGCSYQHMTHAAEVECKQQQLVNLLEHLGRCSEVNLKEPVLSSVALRYRNKISMHVRGRGDDRVIGYYMKDNRTVLDVPNCPLAMDPINSVLAECREGSTLGSATGLRGLGSGVGPSPGKEHATGSTMASATELTLRYTEHDGAVYWTDRIAPRIRNLTESTPVGTITVPTKSFFQTNPHVLRGLVQSVSETLNRAEPETVLDLYCGVGMFAFVAAREGANSVLGIDSDRLAIKAAVENARALGFDQASFKHGSAERLLEDALDPIDLTHTAVVLDPPRAGLEKRVIEILGKHKPADIIYVSCAADTMARDVKLLAAHGYRVVDTKLVDMFPRTAYFESVTYVSLAD
jgi:23S rRNA (uracil1939-C5)-methyltransferase